MKKFICVLCSCLGACLLCQKGKAQEGDLFNYENSLKYANYLYRVERYEAASREFERVLFFTPQDTGIQTKLLNSYFHAHDYTNGIRRALFIYPHTDSMPGVFAFAYGKLLLMEESLDELESLFLRNDRLASEEKHLMEVGHAIFSRKWETAQEIYETYSAKEMRLKWYEPIIIKTTGFKQKKPATALVLSTFLPGLGRFYTKQWKDGLISFALIGSLGYASYRNFSRNGRGSILGWIYGGLALGFYAGNLYGSYQSAYRYNDHYYSEIQDETVRLFYNRF